MQTNKSFVVMGEISEITTTSPKQWLKQWRKDNPDKRVLSFHYKGHALDGFRMNLTWEPRVKGGDE